jgi:hypothetical protein
MGHSTTWPHRGAGSGRSSGRAHRGIGFLLNLERLRSLDDHDLRNSCTIFAKTFSHDDSSNVDLHDFISELQVLQVTLPDNLMSALEILQFIIVADYYPNVSTTYLI